MVLGPLFAENRSQNHLSTGAGAGHLAATRSAGRSGRGSARPRDRGRL